MYCLSVEDTRISPALALRGDPRREDDVAAQQLLRIADHEPRVQPDAQPRSGAGVGAVAAGERPLQLDRRVQAAVGAVEGGQEAVPLELHDLTVVVRDESLDEQVVVAQQLLPAFRAQLRPPRAASAMSLSISVIAPSGELSRPTAGVTGSSAEAITSIEVRSAEDSTSSVSASRSARAYLDTPSRPAPESPAGDEGGSSITGFEVSAFPPIGDYAFLSDCETTALVAPNGNVEWLCLPADGFARACSRAILDRDAGGFRVAPGGRQAFPRPGGTSRGRWSSRRAGRRGWGG